MVASTVPFNMDSWKESLGEIIGFAAASFAGFLAANSKGFFLNLFKSKKDPKTDLASLMHKKNEVENYCVIILDHTKASHVGVWRFHNGQTYLNGDSIKKMSLYTEVAINEGLLVDDESQKLDLENFSKAIDSLLKSESKFINLSSGKIISGEHWVSMDLECEYVEMDWHCKKLMKQRTYSNMLWVLLKDPNRNPVGILEISFMHAVDYKAINSVKLSEYKADLEFKLEGKFV